MFEVLEGTWIKLDLEKIIASALAKSSSKMEPNKYYSGHNLRNIERKQKY